MPPARARNKHYIFRLDYITYSSLCHSLTPLSLPPALALITIFSSYLSFTLLHAPTLTYPPRLPLISYHTALLFFRSLSLPLDLPALALFNHFYLIPLLHSHARFSFAYHPPRLPLIFSPSLRISLSFTITLPPLLCLASSLFRSLTFPSFPLSNTLNTVFTSCFSHALSLSYNSM